MKPGRYLRATGSATMQARAIRRKAIIPIVKAMLSALEPNEAPLFFFFVDGIESIEQRFDATIGAPQGDDEPNNETDAECPAPLRGEQGQLIADHFDRSARQDARGGVELIGHAARIGEQAVDRHQCGDTGKQSQESVECDRRRIRQDAILGDPLVDP